MDSIMAFSYVHAIVLNFYRFSSLAVLGNTIYLREETLVEEGKSFRFDAPRRMFTVWCRNWSGISTEILLGIEPQE